MSYARTPGQRSRDFFESHEYEQEVLSHLGPFVVDRTSSSTEIDFWVPGFFLDVKEKRQPLTERWHLLPGVEESNLFVIDELAVRKVLKHYPGGYFWLHDLCVERIFLAASWELAVVKRARVQRVNKAKLIYDVRDFRLMPAAEHVVPTIMNDMVLMPWKQSEPTGEGFVPQV